MKSIELTRGYRTLVDDADYPQLNQWSWYALVDSKHKVYAARRVHASDTTVLRMHQLLIEVPKGMRIDHANGDGLDNRRRNLRAATHSQNSANRRCYAESGFKGVSKSSKNRWRAIIEHSGRTHHLGTFRTPQEAHQAWWEVARMVHGEFARSG